MSKIAFLGLIGLQAVFNPLAFANQPAHQDQQQQKSVVSKGQLLPAKEIVRGSKNWDGCAETIIFEEDFESGVGSWYLSGSWDIGTPTSGPYGGYSSPNCAATNLYGEYPNDASDWLQMSGISLPTLGSPSDQITLTFWEWFEIESGWDYGSTWISTDGGTYWIQMDTRDGFSDWRETEIDLSSYQGYTVDLLFYFYSDYSVTYTGWYVDDIQITVQEATPPPPLEATMVSLQENDFFVYMNVAVDTNGAGYPGLDESDFTVYENGVPQDEYFEVIPPDTGGGVRLADIVFVLDVTGSMGGEIEAVRDNMESFILALSASDINYGIGFVVFGDIVYVYNDYQFYYDEMEILSIIDNIELGEHGIGSGEDWPENQLEAMAEAVSMNYRIGAQKIQIMLTDANAHENDYVTVWTVNNLINLLVPANAIVFPVFDTSELNQQNQYIPIAEATNPNGTYFYIYDNFNDIIDEISGIIGNTYVVSYLSNNRIYNGVERFVTVEVTYEGYVDTCNGSYIPGMAPVIERTPATLELHTQAWAEGTSLTIEAHITDYVVPYVQSATLRYRNTDSTSWTSISMDNVSDSTYAVIIPTNAVNYPGVDYYITATDGQSSVTDPSVEPNNNPYQIAILPNEAPVVDHTPVSDLVPGSDVTITAEITDNTNYLDFAKLHYRKVGQLTFQELGMTNTYGNTYEAVIPAAYVTSGGVDYYIYAQDDLGVGSLDGTADKPHTIGGVPSTILYFTSNPASLLPVSFATSTDVALMIQGADNVAEVQGELEYDSSKVEITEFTTGEFLAANGGTVTDLSNYNNGTGILSVSLTTTGGSPPGVSGEGTLALITFRAKVSDPTSDVMFTSSTLEDPLNSFIDHATVNGKLLTISDLLGDFEDDMDVDFADYTLFVYYWNQEPDDPIGDIAGPAPGGASPGLPPWSSTNYPYPGGDGVIDFDDQMAFALMYNWWYSQTTTTTAGSLSPSPYIARTTGTAQPLLDVPQSADVGETFAVELTLQDLRQIIGWHLILCYDGDILSYAGNNLDEILDSGSGLVSNFDQHSDGRVEVSRVLVGHPGVTSDGSLTVEFYFETKKAGNAHLRMELIDLRDLGNTRMALNAGSYNGDYTVAVSGQLPSQYTLQQNHPNPFNPVTLIEYSLPKDSRVNLTIYNIAGQEVATLVDGHIAAGHHQVPFAAENLSSGIYFYKLSTPGFTAIRKMLIIK